MNGGRGWRRQYESLRYRESMRTWVTLAFSRFPRITNVHKLTVQLIGPSALGGAAHFVSVTSIDVFGRGGEGGGGGCL